MPREPVTLWTLDALYALYAADLTTQWFPFRDHWCVLEAAEHYPGMTFRGAG